MVSLKIATLFLLGLTLGAQAQAAKTCLNFSGQWQGQCSTASGQYRNLTLSLAQNGCESIIYNGRMFPVGQVIETVIKPQPGHPPSYSYAYEMMEITNAGKELVYSYYGEYEQNKKNPISWQSDLSTNFKIVGRNLVTTTVDTVNNFSETCQFNKR